MNITINLDETIIKENDKLKKDLDKIKNERNELKKELRILENDNRDKKVKKENNENEEITFYEDRQLRENGLITIPRKLRRDFNYEKGDKFMISCNEKGEITLIKK